ncbi:MAG: tol-pal system protein YbgF [Bosea sp.]|uniref:tol-pal system protein YbgF n=1 Tax=unclassified Bosea (in: a-proteobacteria) TaxID=2653178 RepID=UPI00095A0D6C|nr:MULTISPECIES: tol-pal system protein YbgF [unclassified Bosea (in: a-proteobacteria)]MBN9458875.1 tol-pal system protein YbgF [Bosea sp. (in: a-proteobacteria)]OJV04446.1 MAG: tol-pal system protein YbgF [Bosea sp. 67-29]
MPGFSLARLLARPAWPALALAAGLSGATAPAFAQDAADLLVRTTRLENQMRQMAGQIEQLQFENKRLTEQLSRFQQDVDFRLNEKGGGGRPSAGSAPPATPPAGGTPQRQRRGDAFDPSTQQGAAGAPQPLGGGISGIIEDEYANGPASGQPLDLQGVGRPVQQGAVAGGPRGQSVAAASGPATAKEAYDSAYAALKRRAYEQAEMGFRQFLQSYPRDRLAVDATYWLGESYMQRQRYREAAEQFLKISKETPRAAKAPDSLLRLGMALSGLGAKEQACATYAKVGVDYPQASSALRNAVARERRRSGCA